MGANSWGTGTPEALGSGSALQTLLGQVLRGTWENPAAVTLASDSGSRHLHRVEAEAGLRNQWATWGPPHISPKMAPTPNLCPTLWPFRGHIPEFLSPVPVLKGTPGERLFSQQNPVLSPWVSQPRELFPGQAGALGV